jgi:hypothetical protein
MALFMAKGKVEGKEDAAELLGINPCALRHRMIKLGVPFGRSVKNEYIQGWQLYQCKNMFLKINPQP